MSEGSHVAYLRLRAATERELAQDSPADYITRLHLEMAALYDVLANDPGIRSDLDGRRVFVRLSPKGVSAMEAYFQR